MKARWFDTLFARIFLLQVGVAVLLVIMLILVLFSHQASVFAKAALPSWSAALMPVQAQLLRGETPVLPQGVDVLVPVDLEPGPPPQRAHFIAPTSVAPRYNALREGLRERGIEVGRMAVSGEHGESITWLEITMAHQSPVWVGIHGALENPGLRMRGMIGLGLAVFVFLLAAVWLSRIVARPLQDLQRSVIAFSETGERPLVPVQRGPIELRQLAQQFDIFAAQRVQQDDARAMMLAGISHDLRSPLGRIRLAAELLPEAPGVAVRRETIVRNVQLADDLVGSFIALVRTATEPLDERVDLHALVRELLGNGDHADVHARLPAENEVLCVEPASRIVLQRCLLNLLDNARRYGLPPLEVVLQAQGGEVVLSVRDHGPGMSPAQRETLLKPFYRGTKDRGQPGTGLGLPVVERAVRRHGGQMALLDAEPGLRVTLHLPLAE